MIQVSMDGPSTNWAFYASLQLHREKEELPQLLNIGSCVMHIVHGAFKTGAESTSWELKNILKGACILFHDTPARRDDYTSITGSIDFPCRSVPLAGWETSQLLISIWDNIVSLVRHWEKLSKSKESLSLMFRKHSMINSQF